METISASEVKQSFGEVLLKAQKEPIGINKNGKPAAVLLSARDYEAYKEGLLKIELAKGMESALSGNVIPGEEVIADLRKLITDA